MGTWLDAWAGDRGEVASEWRFYFLTDKARPSSLLPDVAYFSYERLPRDLPRDARERPRSAPDIAVEIWSPGDRMKTWDEKIGIYLAHGARVVIALRLPRHSLRRVNFTCPGTTISYLTRMRSFGICDEILTTGKKDLFPAVSDWK